MFPLGNKKDNDEFSNKMNDIQVGNLLKIIEEIYGEIALEKANKFIENIDKSSQIDKKSFTKNEYSVYLNSSFKMFETPEEEFEWAKEQFKRCSKCKEDKKLIEFSFNTSGRDHFDRFGYRLRRPDCNICYSKINSSKRIAQKKSGLIDLTGKCCEICGSTNRLVYDHDHNTAEYRGILCDSCNKGIGLCGETTDGLILRINYLLKNTNKKVIIVDG